LAALCGSRIGLFDGSRNLWALFTPIFAVAQNNSLLLLCGRLASRAFIS